MRVRPLAITMAVVGLLGACGGSETATTPTSSAVSTRVSAVTSTTSSTAATITDHGRQVSRTPEELAFLIEDLPKTTSTTAASTTTTEATTATTAASSGGGPPATSGSGGRPVTTVAAGPPVDPMSIYKGFLGKLDPDEVVAGAVASAPTVGPGVFPLTGLGGDVPNRPAAVVKIDNGSRARPQTGLNSADIVVEEEVEGGITRFAAIFHSNSTIVGPVRSGRTTDIGVLMGLGSPMLMYSGANEVTDALLLARTNVQNRNAGRSSGYWRQKGRRAPSNLYTDTAPHWASAAGGPPPPQFAYRDPGEAAPGDPVSGFTVAFRSNRAAWEWDGQAWLRSQGGRAHTVASGARVSAANVVVVETQKIDTGMVDSSGAGVPEFVFVGSGRAAVFTEGKKVTGTWTRPTLASVATLTTGDGAVIELTPGRTWIELIQADAGILQ